MTTDDFIGKVNDLDGVYASKHRERSPNAD